MPGVVFPIGQNPQVVGLNWKNLGIIRRRPEGRNATKKGG
jgi:hypothetical protein